MNEYIPAPGVGADLWRDELRVVPKELRPKERTIVTAYGVGQLCCLDDYEKVLEQLDEAGHDDLIRLQVVLDDHTTRLHAVRADLVMEVRQA